MFITKDKLKVEILEHDFLILVRKGEKIHKEIDIKTMDNESITISYNKKRLLHKLYHDIDLKDITVSIYENEVDDFVNRINKVIDENLRIVKQTRLDDFEQKICLSSDEVIDLNIVLQKYRDYFGEELYKARNVDILFLYLREKKIDIGRIKLRNNTNLAISVRKYYQFFDLIYSSEISDKDFALYMDIAYEYEREMNLEQYDSVDIFCDKFVFWILSKNLDNINMYIDYCAGYIKEIQRDEDFSSRFINYVKKNLRILLNPLVVLPDNSFSGKCAVIFYKAAIYAVEKGEDIFSENFENSDVQFNYLLEKTAESDETDNGIYFKIFKTENIYSELPLLILFTLPKGVGYINFFIKNVADIKRDKHSNCADEITDELILVATRYIASSCTKRLLDPSISRVVERILALGDVYLEYLIQKNEILLYTSQDNEVYEWHRSNYNDIESIRQRIGDEFPDSKLVLGYDEVAKFRTVILEVLEELNYKKREQKYIIFKMMLEGMKCYFGKLWRERYEHASDKELNYNELLSEFLEYYGTDEDKVSIFTYYLMDKGFFEDRQRSSYCICRFQLMEDLSLINRKKRIEYLMGNVALEGKKKKIAIEDIDLMDGYEFEKFIEELFDKMGYIARVTKGSGDQGLDVIAQKGNNKIGIQAKCYTSKVSNKAVQEIAGAMKFYDCNKGLVITNNYFTKSAIELAEANNIQLWDRDFLKQKIRELY